MAEIKKPESEKEVIELARIENAAAKTGGQKEEKEHGENSAGPVGRHLRTKAEAYEYLTDLSNYPGLANWLAGEARKDEARRLGRTRYKKRKRKNKSREIPQSQIDIMEKRKQSDNNADLERMKSLEAQPVDRKDIVPVKLLRATRYFGPQESSHQTCSWCGEDDHIAEQCIVLKQKKNKKKKKKKKMKVCFVCGHLGHDGKRCKKAKEASGPMLAKLPDVPRLAKLPDVPTLPKAKNYVPGVNPSHMFDNSPIRKFWHNERINALQAWAHWRGTNYPQNQDPFLENTDQMFSCHLWLLLKEMKLVPSTLPANLLFNISNDFSVLVVWPF